MTSPAVRAARLRGALVSACSAAVSVLAHDSADGAIPSGAALVVLTVACAAVGAAASGVFRTRRHGCHLTFVALALGFGQLVGHVALTVAAHGHCLTSFSPRMALAHATAVPVCALLIALVEHLYAVCTSVLRWLTVFFVSQSRAPALRRCRPGRLPVAQRIVACSGLTRAPPQLACA
ncbi:hypothetical protein [Mycolicibacterium elephantis]